MSSARKRQKATRMAAMIDRANQTAMYERHHANVMASMAEATARRHDALYAALAELVALKDMKDEMSHMLLREEGGIGIDYDKRKPLAWQRARELVGSNDQAKGREHSERPA